MTTPVHAATLIRTANGTKLSTAGSPTSVSATFASAATAGDMLIAVVGAKGSATITGPSGWSQAINQAGTVSQAIFYKRADGGETAVTTTVNANPGSIGIHIYEYSGATAFMEAGSSFGSSNAPVSGTVTTSVSNELVLAAFTLSATGNIGNASWANGTEGFTERLDFNTNPGGTSQDAIYAGGDNLTNTAGARSVTVSGPNTAWRGQIVRFQNDTTAPTVTGVASSLANGAYGVGQVVPIQVTFSENVTVVGNPQLTLATGSPATTALNYVSGSNSTTLTFDYTVAAGNFSADLDYASTSALALNGGTIKDAAGNNATLTLAAPGAAGSLGANKNIAIDGAAPTVSNVTSSLANGAYTVGQVVPIQITFNENVIVTGVPQLTLATGSPATTALNYVSGSNSTTLTFDYAVAAGNASSDLDYASAGALALHGGTIKDALGNNATLTLAAPGAAGSLGANKNIVVDTSVPTVNLTSSSSGTTNVSPIPVTVTFSEGVSLFVVEDIVVTNGAAINFHAVSGSVYTFDVTPSGQGSVTASIPAGRAQDAAGNQNIVSNTLSRTYDSIAPTVTLTTEVTSPTSMSDILFTATFSEPVTGFVLSGISATHASVGDFSAVSDTVYTFDVYPEGDPHAAVVVTVSVPAGKAQDAAGNGNTASDSGEPRSLVFDGHVPTVSLTSGVTDPTRTSPIPVTATFSEDVLEFEVGDLAVTGGVADNFNPVSGMVYTFDVTPSGQGTVTVTVPADVAHDVIPHFNLASNTLSRVYDTVPPTVNLTSSSSGTTNVSPIPVTATFSEGVSLFVVEDIVVTNGAAINFHAVSGSVYTFDVTPSGQGSVTASIPAGRAQDAAGNQNIVSNTLSRTYDSLDPTLVQVTPVPSFTNDSTPSFTFSSTEIGAIAYSGSCASSTTSASAGNNTITFNALADGLYNDCGLVVTDAAGNHSVLLVADAFTVDTVAPSAITDLALSSPTTSSIVLTWTAPGNNGHAGTAASYDVRYSTSPINGNFASASQTIGEPTPLANGTVQTMTVTGLSAGTPYYFAIKTSDEVPNVAAISNVPSLSTSVAPDVTAPAAITDLALSSPMTSSITLTWTAPGDDGAAGTAASYDIRYSMDPIVTSADFSRATTVIDEPAPLASGSVQSMTVRGLTVGTTYYFAIVTSDEAPNISGISNIPTLATIGATGNLIPIGNLTDLALSIKASPSTLPAGGGSVTFTYEARNLGEQHISNIRVGDDLSAGACEPVVYHDGDLDSDGVLDPSRTETWSFTCTKTVTVSETHIAQAAGTWNYGEGTSNEATAAVAVGESMSTAGFYFHVKVLPSTLHAGGETASLQYAVENLGDTPISDLAFSGSDCRLSELLSGDANGNRLLDANETWLYSCSKFFGAETQLMLRVTGISDGFPISDSSAVTISVGAPSIQPHIHLHAMANPARLPYGGGTTYLTYHVYNDDDLPISDVTLTSGSDSCAAPTYEGGDANGDNLLQPGEQWTYTCVEHLTKTEIDTPTVRGQADGRWTSDDALFITPVAESLPPAEDPTATGAYDPSVARNVTPDIDMDLGLETAPAAEGCVPGISIKLPDDRNPVTQTDSTVYYCGRDAKRHAFSNAKVFLSWYPNFLNVRIVEARTLERLPLGAPVTSRPGGRLIKSPHDPRVYAVSRGGTLRLIATEAQADAIYGADWRTWVDDLPDAFLRDYAVGDPIPNP